MPAKSEKQAHLARMAMAIAHGHELKGVSQEGRAKARAMAKSMSYKALSDFAHVAKKPKKKG
jgi:hypothetical protein